MMLSSNRVFETTATAGTGPITLLGAKQGPGLGSLRSFSAAFGVGVTFYYSIVDTIGGAWEIGEGVLTDQFTMTRTRVLSSSNANALVSFSSAGKDVSSPNIASTYADRTSIQTLISRDGTTGVWRGLPSAGVIQRVRMTGTGTVTMDSATGDLGAGTVTSGSYTYSVVGLQVDDYAYPGDAARSIRFTLTGTAAVEVY